MIGRGEVRGCEGKIVARLFLLVFFLHLSNSRAGGFTVSHGSAACDNFLRQ